MNFLEYVLPEYNLKINYPTDWIKLDPELDPINIAFFPPSPKGTPFSIKDTEGLYIIIMNPSTGIMTLEDWVNGNIEDMKLQFPDFTIHESFPRTIPSTNGRTIPAYQIVYSQSVLKTLLIMALKDEKSYQFNYTSDREHYERFYPVIHEMLSSIEFLV
ncbi:hypothetical protein BH18THE2_BH18THE2_32030 [soil metagenome]